MVGRHPSYKVTAQVNAGHVALTFCWGHVRRDFTKVSKGWDSSKAWALAWLRRPRALNRHQDERQAHEADGAGFTAADIKLREAVAAMEAQSEMELADPGLPTHCRKVLASLQGHWTGLTRFVDDLRIPLNNNASERQIRGSALVRKDFYGSGRCGAGIWRRRCSP